MSVADSIRAVFLPYQTAWFLEEAQIAIIEKARRIGITWVTAAIAVLHAAVGEGRGDAYYQSFNKDMTEGFIRKCAEWLTAFLRVKAIIDEDLEPDPDDPTGDARITVFRIRLPNGRKIEALPSSPRAIRSKGDPGDLYILDEAAFVGPGVKPQDMRAHLAEVLKAALAVTTWGGRVLIISTHNGDENPFNEYCRDAASGRLSWAHHRVTLDDAIEQGFVERINEIAGMDRAREEYRQEEFEKYPTTAQAEEELLCRPRPSSGVYIPRHLVRACMAPGHVIEFDASRRFNLLPPDVRAEEMQQWIELHLDPELDRLDLNARHCFGFDFARSGHLSVLSVLRMGSPMRCALMVEMRNTPHEQQQQLVLHVGRALPRFAGGHMDATGAGDAVAEHVADRLPGVEKVKVNLEWNKTWIPHYKGLLESREIEMPDTPELLDDHRAFTLVGGVPKVAGGSGDRHGDGAVSLVFAACAADAWRALPMTGRGAGSRTSERSTAGFRSGDPAAAAIAARSAERPSVAAARGF